MRTFSWIVSITGLMGISIFNALDTWNQASAGRKWILASAIAATAVILVVDVTSWWKNRQRKYETEEEINEYMQALLRRGGSANIFACNLTWVTQGVREFMVNQARGNRVLKLYVPRHNAITRDLAANGVRVITYESLGYEPEARFTLVNPEEPGSSLLAVGKGTVPNFIIEEFTDRDHARMISITRDLFHILDRVTDEEE